MKVLDVLSLILLIIGGLNWGAVGFFQIDLVARLLGEMTLASRLIYALVGLAALYEIVLWRAIEYRWGIRHRTIPEVHA